MTHINSILEKVARDFISKTFQQTRYRYVFRPETFEQIVEEAGGWRDLSLSLTVGYLLTQPAGPAHDLLSIGDLLNVVLIEAAAEHSTRPSEAVERFLGNLARRSLEQFLEEREAKDVKQRDARIRRILTKHGFRLEKSRKRDPFHSHCQVYDVVECATNIINLEAPRSLERLERWVDELKQNGGVITVDRG